MYTLLTSCQSTFQRAVMKSAIFPWLGNTQHLRCWASVPQGLLHSHWAAKTFQTMLSNYNTRQAKKLHLKILSSTFLRYCTDFLAFLAVEVHLSFPRQQKPEKAKILEDNLDLIFFPPKPMT